MPSLTINYETTSERLLLEAAISYGSTMHQTAKTASLGSILPVCEEFTLDQGKGFLRQSLELALNGSAEELDKKGGSRGCVRYVTGLVGIKASARVT